MFHLSQMLHGTGRVTYRFTMENQSSLKVNTTYMDVHGTSGSSRNGLQEGVFPKRTTFQGGSLFASDGGLSKWHGTKLVHDSLFEGISCGSVFVKAAD